MEITTKTIETDDNINKTDDIVSKTDEFLRIYYLLFNDCIKLFNRRKIRNFNVFLKLGKILNNFDFYKLYLDANILKNIRNDIVYKNKLFSNETIDYLFIKTALIRIYLFENKEVIKTTLLKKNIFQNLLK